LAGIYLHVPFCKQACAYCNFHFTTSLRFKKDLVNALLQETVQEKNYLEGEPAQTIYFGGGTPSLLDAAECAALLEAIKNHFPIAEHAEVTLEANPDDITREKLSAWKHAGINRLSMGVQSFFEEELRWMNRAHQASQSRQAIEWSLEAGFTNMSIDLIYGSPLLTDEMWEHNVQTALSYGIPHLSCYALTVEEKTPLYKQIHSHRKADVNMDHQANQFLLLMHWLREAGYEHYEVSNFARPGHRSRHNSSYWKGDKYLGLGPSAHSYNGKERRWNVANNALYIKGIQEAHPIRETEHLTATQQLNEYIMISLRTAEGLDLFKIESGWGTSIRNKIERQLQPYLQTGLVTTHQTYFRLTDEGMLRADGIASALFEVEW
jgi:oxygen-independent coproporphyrinogen III oxidase